MAVYLQSQGIIPVVSLISPYAEARDYIRSISKILKSADINLIAINPDSKLILIFSVWPMMICGMAPIKYAK